MNKGCVRPLLTWAAAAAVYWMVLREQLPSPVDAYASLAAGLLMWMAIDLLRTAWLWVARARKIGGAPAPMMGERPQDGEVVTIAGRIRATGPLLTAPFSGRPAVLYSCDVKDPRQRRRRGSEPLSVYSGVALTPSVIDTPAGAIRLLGFPLPSRTDAAEIAGAAERENAAAWIGATPFRDFGGFQVAAMYREMKDLVTDDDGEVQKFWRSRDDPSLSGKQLFEFAVAPGEQVCVVGQYSAEKNGIVPGTGGGTPIQLLRGDSETVRRTMWKKAIGSAVAAIVMAAITNGALFAFVRLRD